VREGKHPLFGSLPFRISVGLTRQDLFEEISPPRTSALDRKLGPRQDIKEYGNYLHPFKDSSLAISWMLTIIRREAGPRVGVLAGDPN